MRFLFVNKIILAILFIPHCLLSHSVFILIHGTWAFKEPWHMPGGVFFDELEYYAHFFNIKIVPYRWEGANNHKTRVHAAKGLVKLIQSYPKDIQICIVAHSHGTNVGIIASQLLVQDEVNKHHIEVFYALGTPINSDYQPDMHIINYFYNLFSFEDFVQPVLGIFKRCYNTHERIANICITINGKEPGHCELHDPVVAQWLPGLHESLMNKKIDLIHPGIIHFYSNREPKYEIDKNREELIEQDLELSKLILLSFRSDFLQYDLKYHSQNDTHLFLQNI